MSDVDRRPTRGDDRGIIRMSSQAAGQQHAGLEPERQRGRESRSVSKMFSSSWAWISTPGIRSATGVA